MKAFRNIFMAAMLAFTTQAVADDFAYLTVSQDNGSSSFQVSQISKITFDASNMVLHLSDGTTQQLPLASLSKMFFSASAQGIATISAASEKIHFDGGQLRLDIGSGEQAVIYNLKGQQLFTATTSTEYNLNTLPKGVYIVRVGNQTKKVMNR